jgi:hypothetical protein
MASGASFDSTINFMIISCFNWGQAHYRKGSEPATI